MADKYEIINKIKKENPKLSWTEAANMAGFEGKWTSYKGKAKPRSGNRSGQAARRAQFDQVSTELAAYESKKIKQQSSDVNVLAEMYGLEPTQIEHLADQSDVLDLTAGAGGDPTNLAQVRQSEARFKDRVKLAVGDKFGVTLNPAQESVKVIPREYFDPIADPNTLPGVDIPIGSDFEVSGGSIRLNRARMTALAGAGLAGFSWLGTAASAAETVGRGQIAAQTKNPLDFIQTGLSALSTAADVVPVIGEVVSTPADAANVLIDTARESAKAIKDPKVRAEDIDAYRRAMKPHLYPSKPPKVKTKPKEKSTIEKVIDDPMNELEYAGKQILGGLKVVGGAILFGF